jgi:hypothetical protein
LPDRRRLPGRQPLGTGHFHLAAERIFTDSANLTGGMLRWRAEGHPVEGGSG